MKQSTRLGDFMPYRLSVTSNAVSGRISQEYRSRFGLSIPEWRVMAVLGDAGGLTQRDLTRLTLMDKVAVNRACKVLEERQLVVREPNASDGRSHLLELTESGKAMHSQIMPLALEMERRLFARFSDEEVDTFRALLGRVMNEAEDLDTEALDGNDYGLSAAD